MSDTQRTQEYEVMFLISQAEANDFGGVIDHINNLFQRSSAEVIAMQKWDERRLAYEIDKQKRGVYILAYVKAPTENMQSFERDCNISERILRTLVTKAEHLTLEEMQAFDRREELQSEAKERAAKAAEREQAGMSDTVSLGAPVKEEPKEEAPKEEAGSDAAESGSDENASENTETAEAGAKTE